MSILTMWILISIWGWVDAALMYSSLREWTYFIYKQRCVLNYVFPYMIGMEGWTMCIVAWLWLTGITMGVMGIVYSLIEIYTR